MAKSLFDLKGYLLTNVMLVQVSDPKEWNTGTQKGVTYNLGFTDKKDMYLVTCNDAELVNKLQFGNVYHIALNIRLNTFDGTSKQSIKLVDFVDANAPTK